MGGVELYSERLLIRTPRFGDGVHYGGYYRANRDFLQPFSPTFETAMFSDRDWEASIATIQQQLSTGIALRFLLFRGGEMVGVANLTQVTRAPSHSAILGYTLAEEHQGQGLMREALERILDYAFLVRNLHRIRAEYMPRNQRSGRLLRRLGFHVDGFSRDHLLIDGVWEDHVLTSLVNDAWRG